MAVFGSIRQYWQYLAVFGSIWQYLALFGSIWQYSAVFGSIRQYFLPTRDHQTNSSGNVAVLWPGRSTYRRSILRRGNIFSHKAWKSAQGLTQSCERLVSLEYEVGPTAPSVNESIDACLHIPLPARNQGAMLNYAPKRLVLRV